jgi:hypothetical protein
MSYEASLEAFQRGDYTVAERLLRDLDAAQPNRAKVVHDLGSAIAAQGRFDEARPLYERVHAALPDHKRTALTTGILRLATGDYPGGWPLFDLRFEFPDYSTVIPPFTPWRGESLAGKTICIAHEQGFGDQIMCARFAPILKRQGARVFLVTQAPLFRLFQQLGVEVFSYDGAGIAFPVQPDYYTHPFSIARWLGVTPATIPGERYLTGRPSRCGGVGLKWRGRQDTTRRAMRSLPDDLAQRMLESFGAISLEPEDTGARDFQDTADIIAGLDRVISVDTAVAHLAGAMGKPTSILLPVHATDWRWMQDRSDSPWYPSATLYRQKTPGEWGEVVRDHAHLCGEGQ